MDNKPLEPGDICILVASRSPQNIGRSVEIVEYLGVGNSFTIGEVEHYSSGAPVESYYIKTCDGEPLIVKGFCEVDIYPDMAVTSRPTLMKIGDSSPESKVVSAPVALAV